MALVIKGSSSGQITIDVPAAAGTNTITLPAETFTVSEATTAPAFAAYNDPGATVNHNTQTQLIPDTELFDSDGAYDTSTGTFTVPSGKGGKYFVTAGVSVTNLNDGSLIRLGFKVNDAYPISGSIVQPFEGYSSVDGLSNAGDPRAVSSFMTNLSAGDTLKIFALHNHGAGRSCRDQFFGAFKLTGL